MVNLRNLGRSRRITAKLWRHAANQYVNNLTKFGGTVGVVGLAADTVATIARGTKRAGDSIRDIANKRVKRNIFGMTAMDEGGSGRVVHDPNASGYSQKKRVRSNFGQRSSKTEKKLKLIGAAMQSVIHRFQFLQDQLWLPPPGTEPFPGAYALSYNTAANNNEFPLYLFDLTCAYENTLATIEARGCPFTRLFRSSITNQYGWEVYPGRNADNSADIKSWLVERSPNEDVFVPVGDKAHIDWCDIKMQLYGARKVPVRIKVQLVQFHDEDYVPSSFWVTRSDPGGAATAAGSAPTTIGTEVGSRYGNFWMTQVDRLLGNTVKTRGIKIAQTEIMKVLYTKEFDFEPIMSTEGDQAPHNVQFELKYNMDKVITYTERVDLGSLVANEEFNANEWLQYFRKDKNSVFCAGEGRVYLMITGETHKDANTLTADERVADYAGSFDLLVRRKSTAMVLR